MQGNRPLIVVLTLLALAGVVYTIQVSDRSGPRFPTGKPSRIVMVNGYPEFHVDQKPFFMHSAAFYYYRIPRERWEESLHALKRHGINTIDLYIIWNWHQPAEDALDLDGRTNPRRDLKGLLRLIARMGFKLSVRPGPFICSEWKNGGYPDWLLTRPEYGMPLKDVLEGRYPRLSALQYEFSEEAARRHLENPTHLRYTRKWYEDVFEVVRPHLATQGGNVILLQVDDDQALDRYNYSGPNFWKYLNLLRNYLQEAARDKNIPVYFNPADMRDTGASASPTEGAPFWAMGQYYQEEGFGSDVLRAEDSSSAKYLTEILKTQPGFPPFFIEYQAGWFAGAEDVRARATDPTNTLLSSRFLFQNGVKGINYFPLQDTLFPAGYECPWSNYFYSWESAIGYEGDLRPRAEASIRNGRLIEGLGTLLAASHYAADIGVVHPISAFPQERLTREDITGIVFRTQTAIQHALFNQLSPEIVDLEHQSLKQIGRYKVILLPVPSGSTYRSGQVPAYLELSLRSQAILREYVQQGGTVVAYPSPPRGRLLEELFPVRERGLAQPAGSPLQIDLGELSAAVPGEVRLFPEASADSRVRPFATIPGEPPRIAGYRRSFGKGSAVVLGAEFNTWVPLRSASSELDTALPAQPQLGPEQAASTGQVLEVLLAATGVRRAVSSATLKKGVPAQQPQLGVLHANAAAPSGTGSAYGFLSITNFSPERSSLQAVVQDPRTGQDLALPAVDVGGRDALMLPLRVRLRDFGIVPAGNPNSADEILFSTAELTSVRATGSALELEFYSKSRAAIRMYLEHAPSGSPTIGTEKVEYRYYPATRLMDIDLPQPKEPSGVQILTLPYRSGNAASAPAAHPRQISAALVPTTRVPVRDDVGYGMVPTTVSAGTGQEIAFSFVHPPNCLGKCVAQVNAPDLVVSRIQAEQSPAFTVKAPYERNYIRNLEWTLETQGITNSGAAQVIFIAPGSAVAVERDVDRDGYFDYVLENERIRLILFPHAGARSFAFVRKDTGTSAFTSIGGMRDAFQVQRADPPDQDRLPAWTRHGIPGMHNRYYAGRLVQDSGQFVEVQMGYDAPDVAPAGAWLERTVRLNGSSDFVDVAYKILPRDPTGDQGYAQLNSVALGSMEDESGTVLRTNLGDVALKKGGQGSVSGPTWATLATRDGKELFSMSWAPGAFRQLVYDRRDYSLLLRLESPRWERGKTEHVYRVRYLYSADTPQARQILQSEKTNVP